MFAEFGFVLVFVMMTFSSRSSLIQARGGMIQGEIFLVVLGFASTIIGFSMLIWSFKAIAWWVPLCLLTLGAFPAGLFITNRNLGFWKSLEPFLDVAAISGGIYLWYAHNPF